MIMAGFAGNPHMIACTVLALTKLVHDHRGIVRNIVFQFNCDINVLI